MDGRALLIALAAAGLTACGGGSSSSDSGSGTGSVVGLELPSNVSVVTAQGGSGASGVVLKKAGGLSTMGVVTLSSFPATSQINTDPTQSYVWDESMNSLSTVNEILCYISQTGASSMVNKGAYTALVDENKCRQGQDQSSSASTGQSSTTQTVQYNKWTIEATRADNSSPEFVHVWVPGKPGSTDPQDSQTILVEMTVTEGVSDTNPFGKFSMNFEGVVDGSLVGGTAGTQVEMMKGSLKTVDNASGTPQFQFIDLEGHAANSTLPANMSHSSAVNVVLDDSSGTTGRARTADSDTHDDGMGGTQTDQGAYVVAFDANDFLRGKDADNSGTIDPSTEETCTSRTDFTTNVWNYNLYYESAGTFMGKPVTAGQRVELNSGYPFVYDNNGTQVNGNVSYWGLWTEDGVSIPDGATITKVSYDNSSASENQTLHIAPGKLVRRTAHMGNLTDFQGQEFQYFGFLPSNPNVYGQYFVTVGDGTGGMTANHFYATDSFVWGDNGPVRTALGSAEDVTPTTDGMTLDMQSDALGGQVIFVYDSSVAAANWTITYYTQDFINSADSTLFASSTTATLYCYDRCLKGGIDSAAVQAATSEQDFYHSTSFNLSAPWTYTATVSNGKVILTDDSNGLEVSTDGLDLSAFGHDWGIASGEMVTDTSVLTSTWDIYNTVQSYHWETGSNDWNHMVTVVDANNNTVNFDPPLSFNYTHVAGNDANGSTTYVGQTFLLQYGGPGQLWGFPGVQDANNRWSPAVDLASGSELTDANSNVFVVKEMESEQHMKDVPLSDCSSLDVTGLMASLPLPTASDIGAVSITLADKPTVADAPAVIAGEVQ
jgi:hypothetical protein